MTFTTPKDFMFNALAGQRAGDQLAVQGSLQNELASIYAEDQRERAKLAREQAEIDNIARKMALRAALGKTIGSALGGGVGSTVAGVRTWDARGRPSFQDILSSQ